jgi:hypothetical protein
MNKIGPKYDKNSGVSEVIGFILVLGIIMAGIAIVTLYGYPALIQAQESSNIKNMQKNMIVLQNDFKSLAFKSIPYKETSIQISGGSLFVIPGDHVPNPFFNITYYNTSLGGETTLTFYPGDILYVPDSGESAVALENGAVHTSAFTGSAMLSEPRWYIDDNSGKKTFVINLIQINTPNSTILSKNGMSTVQMQIHPEGMISQDYSPSLKDVTVRYSNNSEYGLYNYETSWKNYFGSIVQGSPQNPITVSTNQIVINRYTVDIVGL